MLFVPGYATVSDARYEAAVASGLDGLGGETIRPVFSHVKPATDAMWRRRKQTVGFLRHWDNANAPHHIPWPYKADAGGAFTLILDPGSYVITGAPATLLHDAALDAVAGSYTITGFAATLLTNYFLNAAAGAYALTGSPATLEGPSVAAVLSADPGVYIITGSDVTFLAARLLASGAAPGSYVISGFPTTLEWSGAGGNPEFSPYIPTWRRRRR